jgi:hypothetical protein
MQQKSKAQNFQKELKEYSGAVSKYGKAIEKVTMLLQILHTLDQQIMD